MNTFIKGNWFKIGLIAAIVICGWVFYQSQLMKQESIERQQVLKQTQDQKNLELENKMKECESLSPGVMKKWNNVMGVTYDDKLWEECVVTYTDTKTGEIRTSPLRLMQESK